MNARNYEIISYQTKKEHENALKTLRSLYDHINLLDVNTLIIKRLYTSDGEVLTAHEQSFPDYIEEFSRLYIHPDDVEEYRKYSDPEKIAKRMNEEKRSFSMAYFRTKAGDGDYVWKAYIVMRPEGTSPGIYLSCVRSVDTETEHILIKNDYVRLFNELPLAYAVLQVDADGPSDIRDIVCIYASNRLAKMMGTDVNSLIGQDVSVKLAEDQADVKRIMYEAAYKGINCRTIFYSRRAEKWFNIVADRAAATGRCAIILEDVTKEHLTTEFIDREWHTDDLIINCTKLLHSGLPHEEAINQLIKLIGEAIRADRIYIIEKEYGGLLKATYEWCNDDILPLFDDMQQIDEEQLLNWETEFPGAFSLVIENTESIQDSHPVLYQKLATYGTNSIVEIPIRDEGSLIGYFGGINFKKVKNIDLKELMETVSYFLSSEFSRRRLLDELEKKSIYDGLCGVKNRSAMEMVIKKYKKRSFSVGVLYADANGLKTMNDTKGHEAGDELLKNISVIMKRRFNRDYVYRAGGDEFVVIVPKMEKNDFFDACKDLVQDFEAAEGISVAIGYDWGANSTDVESVMKSADTIMYEDKANYYRKNNRRRSSDR